MRKPNIYFEPSRVSHISFDMWNTLISANPEFAQRRNQYVSNVVGKSIDEIRQLYNSHKSLIDNAATVTRNTVAHPSHVHWGRLLNQLTRTDQFYGDNTYIVMKNIHKLFAEFPPSFNPEMQRTMKELIKRGYTLSIGSNTNFISGHVLEQVVVAKWDFDFSFTIYSDIIGSAKPNRTFFDRVVHGASRCNKKVICGNDIIHIGDDMRCDVYGAAHHTLQSAHIKNPFDCVQFLQNTFLNTP